MRVCSIFAGVVSIVGAIAAHAEEDTVRRGAWGVIAGPSLGVDSTYVETGTADLNGTPAPSSLELTTVNSVGYRLGLTWDKPLSDQWELGLELVYGETNFDIAGRFAATLNGEVNDIAVVGDGAVRSLAGMVNAWRFSAPDTAKSRLFWGAGLGYANTEEESDVLARGLVFDVPIDDSASFAADDSGLVWQAGFGWERALGDKVRGRISYRYYDPGKVERVEAATHSVVFGIRF